MLWCACAVRRLDTACWFMLGCVAFIAFSHTACADECTVRLSCVLNTAPDLAAAALCIEWVVLGSKEGLVLCIVCERKRRD